MVNIQMLLYMCQSGNNATEKMRGESRINILIVV